MNRNGIVERMPQIVRVAISELISPGYPKTITRMDAGTSIHRSLLWALRVRARTATSSTSSNGTVRSQST